jgi:hypothetical protein
MSHDHGSFPRAPLVICGTAVLLSIALAAAGRLTGAADGSQPTGGVLVQRDLLFADRADGAVLVFDARDRAAPIEVLAPESNYFVRATMRGLARQRLRSDGDRETPFRLTAWGDGRLTLVDLDNGRTVDMGAFGSDNVRPFAEMLTLKAGS